MFPPTYTRFFKGNCMAHVQRMNLISNLACCIPSLQLCHQFSHSPINFCYSLWKTMHYCIAFPIAHPCIPANHAVMFVLTFANKKMFPQCEVIGAMCTVPTWIPNSHYYGNMWFESIRCSATMRWDFRCVTIGTPSCHHVFINTYAFMKD